MPPPSSPPTATHGPASSNNKTHKIALLQLYPSPMAMAENYAKAERYIRDAAARGAKLAVLPEYYVTGWCPEHERWGNVLEDSGWVDKFSELARELKINLVPGTFLEKITTRSRSTITTGNPIEERQAEKGEERTILQNVAYFIDSNGEILERYVKRNLWHPERRHLESGAAMQGEEHRVFDTEIGKVGLLVCWDLAFPEAFRALIRQGAETIIIPTYWTLNDVSPLGKRLNPLSEALFLESTLVSRAFENTACVVFVNAAGPEAEGWAGRSMVTMPFLGKVDGFGGCEEGLKVVEVDMEVREEGERWYKVREDLENGVVGGCG